jgi:hypothetical protein
METTIEQALIKLIRVVCAHPRGVRPSAWCAPTAARNRVAESPPTTTRGQETYSETP